MKAFRIRRYKETDIDEMLEVLYSFLHDNRGGSYNRFNDIDFDKEKVYNLLKSNVRNILFFCNVVENEDGKIVGGLTAIVTPFIFSKESVAADQLLYLEKDFSNVRAVLELIKSYVEWAKNRGVREVQLSNSTGIKQEEFGKLCELAGFSKFLVGYARRLR